MSSPNSNSSDDPLSQTIAFLDANGNVVDVSIYQITAYAHYATEICINYSSQIGASGVLLVVLLLTTKKERRKSPIFFFNALALFINVIRNILQCIYFTGPFYNFYSQATGDFSSIPRSQYRISVAGVVFTLLLLICIEASLLMQVRVVSATLRDRYRLLLFIFAGITALTPIALRLALTIENIRTILNLTNFFDNNAWLAYAMQGSLVASVCIFSFIFVSKLGLALHQRRKLGIRQFGPMQIIFIMGCQTMIIPAIFSALQFASNVPELGSQVLTILAVFLPLSSMWASAALGDSPSLPGAPSTGNSHRELIGRQPSGASTRRLFLKRSSSLGLKSVFTTTKASNAPHDSPHSTATIREDDLERSDVSVQVARSFDVTTEKRSL